jgi:hypothetical protein
MATLKTLAKRLDFTSEDQYLDYLIDSHINGNFSQCRKLFADMSKADKKGFLKYMLDTNTEADIYNFYFELL